jgi:uncharacterized phage protein (TIGR01671 family)
MREIIFRGKTKDGKWVYGDLVTQQNICIANTWHEVIRVKDETVGQYTGRTDKNGTKIFEGDIVKINGWWNAAGPAGYNENQTVVEFNDEFCGFNPMCDYDCDCGVYHPANECEVIGNVWDNPELLKG